MEKDDMSMSSNPEKLNLKRQKSQEELEKQKKSSMKGRIIAIVGAVVVVALIAGMIYMNTDAFVRNLTAVEIGDQKVSAAEFNYYYSLTFSNVYNSLSNTYGSDMMGYFVDNTKSLKTQKYSSTQTWHEYIVQQTLGNVQNILMLCAEGEKAGFTLSDDQQTELDDRINSLSSQAEAAGAKSVEAYLPLIYGKGVNFDVYYNCLRKTYYANCYSQSVSDGFSLSEADYTAAYEENPNDYDQVTFRAYPFAIGSTGSDDDSDKLAEAAKAKADAMAEALNAAEDKEQTFIDLALENADPSEKSKYEDPDYTLNQYWLKSALTSTYADWLFDASRTFGDVNVVEAGSNYYVLMFQERTNPSYELVNVRHILVKPGDAASSDSSSDSTDATNKEWDLCRQEAEALLDEWKNGDATEDSFAALATEKTEDTASKESGGLYTNVYKGQMLKAFNDWCFDEARQPGDTGIVKTQYGYHIMYFVGDAGEDFLSYRADSLLRTQKYNDWETALTENYPIKENAFGMKRVGR